MTREGQRRLTIPRNNTACSKRQPQPLCPAGHRLTSSNASTASQTSRAASRSAVRLPGTPVIGSTWRSRSSKASSSASRSSRVRSD